MALGRHNVTLYMDELERTHGALTRLTKDVNVGINQRMYFIGAANALKLLMQPDMPDDHVKFVMQLKLHVEEE